MKPGILFFVAADVKDYLVSNGMLLDDGTTDFHDIREDVGIAVVVEQSLKVHGVVIQDQVDKIIQALPLLLSFLR